MCQQVIYASHQRVAFLAQFRFSDYIGKFECIGSDDELFVEGEVLAFPVGWSR